MYCRIHQRVFRGAARSVWIDHDNDKSCNGMPGHPKSDFFSTDWSSISLLRLFVCGRFGTGLSNVVRRPSSAAIFFANGRGAGS
jgi:hypothetical protein